MLFRYSQNRFAYTLILISFLLLSFYASVLGVSYDEAKIFFSGHSASFYLSKISVSAFGQNSFALRFPFVVVHLICALLFYEIAKIVSNRDKNLSLLIFLLLPGLNFAGIIVDKFILLLFLALLVTLAFLQNKIRFAIFLMIIGALSDNGFAPFLLGVTGYAFSNKRYRLGAFVAFLFMVCLIKFGFNNGGIPKGWFLETTGSYFALFSPLVFVFYAYALFKTRNENAFLWHISFWSIALSLILSLRQRVIIGDFAVYGVLAIPLAVNYFAMQWRTKLPEFRLRYKVIGIAVFASLFIWTSLMFFVNCSLLIYLNPKNSPAWPYFYAKELAKELKSHNIYEIDAKSEHLQTQLAWYGIKDSSEYILTDEKSDIKLPISYFSKQLTVNYVTKVNN